VKPNLVARLTAVASLCWLLLPGTGWCALFSLSDVRSLSDGTFDVDVVVNAPIEINSLDAVFNDPDLPTSLPGLLALSFTPIGPFVGHVFDFGGLFTLPPDRPQFGFVFARQALAAGTAMFTWNFSSDGTTSVGDIKTRLTADVTPGLSLNVGETDPFADQVPFLATTAIPEPVAAFLMIVGLGVLGLTRIRRAA
jgi:hypothetical protein